MDVPQRGPWVVVVIQMPESRAVGAPSPCPGFLDPQAVGRGGNRQRRWST